MTSKAENSGKQWSAEEDDRLRELAALGATPFEIARRLNRSETAIKARAYTLRLGLQRFRVRRRGLSKWG
jgi:Myb-like DNA-binding protein